MEVCIENVRTSKSNSTLALVRVPVMVAMYFEILAISDDQKCADSRVRGRGVSRA
jgi:hypothetical protein